MHARTCVCVDLQLLLLCMHVSMRGAKFNGVVLINNFFLNLLPCLYEVMAIQIVDKQTTEIVEILSESVIAFPWKRHQTSLVHLAIVHLFSLSVLSVPLWM